MRSNLHTVHIFFLCLIWQGISAQSSKIDSLKQLLAKTREDSSMMKITADLCLEYYFANQYNEGIVYGRQSVDLADKLLLSDNASVKKLGKVVGAKACSRVGNSYEKIADYPSALLYYKKGLKLKQQLGDKNGMANAYNNIGLIYEDQSDFPTALDYFFTSLDLSTSIGDKRGMARAYNNIGIIYDQQQNYDDAINYYQKSLDIYKALDDKAQIADDYNNIAIICESKNNYLKALDYYRRSLALYEQIGNLDPLAGSYNNLGRLYHMLIGVPDSVKRKFISEYYKNIVPQPTVKDVDLALLDSSMMLEKKSLEICKKIDNKNKLALVLRQIGEITQLHGEYAGALYYFREGAALAKQINTRLEYFEELTDISQCFEKMGKYDSALHYFKQAAQVRDSIFNGEKQKAIGHAEAKFEYEKKQADLVAENKRRLAIEEERRKWQDILLYIAGAGILMLGFFSIFIVQRLRITRQQKSIIEKQKESLDQAFTQLEEAKLLVDEKHKDLTDSIQYASRIQTALLTTQTYLDQHLTDYFILFKPRDIVSGDFYWALQHKGNLYLACCDCTGHGVPGAFMSLLNITFLHQTVIEKDILQPDRIFNNIRSNVIEALNPDGTTDTKDGMDAVLCSINFEKNLLSAACANNPLWIIREGQYLEFKPDKLPIGEGDTSRSFTLHETQLRKGDCIYMFTDGYSDQFGGMNGKKFKQSQLKDLLLSIHRLPMSEQKAELDKAYYRWKGNLEQVDDICVMGVRI